MPKMMRSRENARSAVGPLIALAATTVFLIAADEDIRGGFKSYSDGHGWVGDVGPVITQRGGLGAGLVFEDDRARDTGCLAASAIIQTFLVDHFIKGMSGRQRPFVADGEDHWAGPAGFFKRYDPDYDGLYDSFPSGHAATAFSVATVVALQYRHTTWVPVLAYTIAAGVGLTRMTMDRHWMSDVVVGAVIGHLVARLVVRSHTRRQRLARSSAVPEGASPWASIITSTRSIDTFDGGGARLRQGRQRRRHGLLSKAYARDRAKLIRSDKNDPDIKPGDPYPYEGKSNPYLGYLGRWLEWGRGEAAKPYIFERTTHDTIKALRR